MLGMQNLYLVGPMGTGKTAVGKQLARRLSLPFHDTDAEIEKRAGVNIPFIFEREGEAGFRQREREVLQALVAQQPIVMATGGGAILAADNRALLKTTGTVVYLETSLHQQMQRVGSGRGRPLLQGGDLEARLRQLREIRDPLYREVADVTLSTDNRRVARVVDLIIQQLQLQPPSPPPPRS